MQPELKVWLQDSDRTLLGDYEVRLLEAVARQGTLADGAAALGLSYRSAWGKLKEVEASLGAKLIESTVGGSGGGSSRLTETGARLVDQYLRFRTAVSAYAQQEFVRCFGPDYNDLCEGNSTREEAASA